MKLPSPKGLISTEAGMGCMDLLRPQTLIPGVLILQPRISPLQVGFVPMAL